MANERYTRTNQKIFYAGLSLESWRKAEQGQQLNAQALVQAEREACLFHLYGALLGLCHEIAGYYRLPQDSAPQVETLLAPSMLAAAPSPELAELIELAQQPETWLAQLLGAYNALFEPPKAEAKAKLDPTMPLIETRLLADEDKPALSRETLEDWRQQLKGLTQRFRESLTEW